MIDWQGIAGLAREIAATVLCAAASVFAIAGTVGVFRFADPYTRLQASSLTGTTAVFTILLASLALSPSVAVAARVVVIMVFFLISNPTATHIIARYAWKSGLEPATGPQKRGKRGKRRP
ncbi:MAG: monovalent cation/H(+) antiporter subunit G [Spirochaetes bacterium]|nr:monovalent cation/H(+) antiporter subunit G [Spirochaetota bacterium]MBU1080691.1 monovalent cation/H(+) antiporter subunit G [Spirochaetota bacterium]